MTNTRLPEIEAEEGRLYDGFFSDNFGEKRSKKIAIVGLVGALIFVIIFYFLSPPIDAPKNVVFEIKKGESLNAVSARLKQKKIIHSSFVFKMVAFIIGGQDKIKAGEYYFENSEWLTTIISRMLRGDGGFKLIRVLVPEGTSVSQLRDILLSRLGKDFDEKEFLSLAKDKEGYLFPDTYYFSQNITAKEVVASMQKNFYKKIEVLDADFKRFGRKMEDVIKMASLVEEEANNESDRKKIAGILWKRLDIGMPLQVDAIFQYLIGKGTRYLTLDDLKLDSPYNTYTRKGLPPTPISNPGLQSIRSALNPTETPFLYYLSDGNGFMHYAKTHDEHVRNKEIYLK